MILHKSRAKHLSKKNKSGMFIFIIGVWIILNIAAAAYMLKSRNIYFWDSATYWSIIRDISSGKITASLRGVYDSVAELDYNYTAAMPGAVWTRIFGESRMAYVMGIVNMYLLPGAVSVYLISRRITENAELAAVFILLLFPALGFMAVAGFTDVGGILPCMLCMYLYFIRDEGKGGLWRFGLIGILLVFIVLWRRWYAFFTVSFIAAMLADSLIFRKSFFLPLAAALTCGVIFILFFRDFVFRKLMADYADLYAGYKFSLSTDFKLITRYFGVITLFAAAAGSVWVLVAKKEKRVVFLWIQTAVCFIMFTSTQTHGQQHLLLYMPSLIMIMLIIAGHLGKKALICAAIVAFVNTVNVYIPRVQPGSISEIGSYALIPDFSMLPPVNERAEDLAEMKRRLDMYIEEGKRLGVLASSFEVNDDILRNVEPSLGIKPEREDYIAALPQVDSRDRDMSQMYCVDYILAAFPPQTHLDPKNQRVITEAVVRFENLSGFAAAFEEVPEAEGNIGDINLRLYKRIREVTEEEKAEFEMCIQKQT